MPYKISGTKEDTDIRVAVKVLKRTSQGVANGQIASIIACIYPLYIGGIHQSEGTQGQTIIELALGKMYNLAHKLMVKHVNGFGVNAQADFFYDKANDVLSPFEVPLSAD